MKNPSTQSRVLRSLPRAEMERRWAALRAAMIELNVEAVVAYSAEDFLAGYVRWLTDRPSYYAYGTAVVFHRDDLMTLVEHGFLGSRRPMDGDESEYPGVGELLQTSAFHSVHYTNGYEAELVAEVLRKRGYSRVALAGGGAMPHRFISTLLNLDGVRFVEITEALDRLRAVKSAAEQTEIRDTALMQDRVFQKVLKMIRPGIRDLDIMAEIQAEGRREGSEQAVIMVGSAPAGQMPVMRNPRYQGRMIGPGDRIAVLIENNGAAGFYTELGRMVTVGPPSEAMQDLAGTVVEAQGATLDRFRPGASCAEIARDHDTFMQARGLPPETRLYAHGQGYSLVERPLIRADETMVVEAGMNLVAHPAAPDSDLNFGYVCDNYIVTADGPPERLHQTDQAVFEAQG